MIKIPLNIHWQQMIKSVDLFGSIPEPSVMIANRGTQMADHIDILP
jgi:hypothetical protein